MSNTIRPVIAAVLTLAAALAHAAMPAGEAAMTPAPGVVKPAPGIAKNMVKVRIMIYSGRPDPEFEIPASQIAPMMKRSRLMAYKGGTIVPSTLGYKGVLVENPARAGGLPELFAIYNGKIEAGVAEKTYYADQNRALEKFLVNEAAKRKAVEKEMYGRIQMEISGKGKGRNGLERK